MNEFIKNNKIKCYNNCGEDCWCLPDLCLINLNIASDKKIGEFIEIYYEDPLDEWYKALVIDHIEEDKYKVKFETTNRIVELNLKSFEYVKCNSINLNDCVKCKYCNKIFNTNDFNYHIENNIKCKKKKEEEILKEQNKKRKRDKDEILEKRRFKKYKKQQKELNKISKFKIDEKVFAHWDEDRSEYFLGEIMSINTNKTYDIIFDDGHIQNDVKEVDILELNSKKGVEVLVKKNHSINGKYYKGRVMGANENKSNCYIVKFYPNNSKSNSRRKQYYKTQSDVRHDEIYKPNFCCDKCSLSFSNKYNLKNHIKKHHSTTINQDVDLFSNMIESIIFENKISG